MGDNWVGGDFNDIRTADEKKGGRQRSETSLRGFNDFVNRIVIE